MRMLLYSTKAKPYLEYKQIPATLMGIDNSFEGYRCSYERTEDDENFQLNGKIVAECDYEVEEIKINLFTYKTDTLDFAELCEKSCLDFNKMYDYFLDENKKAGINEVVGYAIHIKNLHIFDEPRELRFYYQKYKGDKHLYNIEKAPRNMMTAIGKQGDVYGLISVTPQEACNILNHKQVVLIRKKVLREMLK
jgi:hypothetical protein